MKFVTVNPETLRISDFMRDSSGKIVGVVMEVAVEGFAPAAPVADPEKSALDEAKDAAEPKDAHGGSKPPEDGNCRECKRLRRLNRLKLCYPCFADLVLAEECEKRGFVWKSGDKHPDFCSCEGLGEHENADGSPRGFN